MAAPKFLTKQKRMVACADAYRLKFNKAGITTAEVSAWMIKHGLYPDVPKRGASIEACLAWEQKLDAAVSSAE